MAQYLETCKLGKTDRGDSAKKRSTEIRNQATFAALTVLLQRRNVDPRLLGSVATVSFPVGGEVDAVIDESGVEPSKENKNLKFFIKYIAVVFASGHQTDPVYMLTDSNMKEDELRVSEVKHLGSSTGGSVDKAYVVFTKTHLANKEFYLWFMGEVVLRAYDFNRQMYNLPCETHDAFLQVMSEFPDCEPMFDDVMIQKMAQKRMIVSKIPFATTALNQMTVLLAPKGYFRRIIPEAVFDNPAAMKALTVVFDEHHTWLASRKDDTSGDLLPYTHWDPAVVQMAKIALLRIQYSNKMTVNQTSIMDSFFETGLYPPSVDRIFDNCYTRIPHEAVANVKLGMDELVRILEARGEISEADLDDLRIEPPTTEKKFRTVDSSMLHRRRVVLLTHSIVLRRELEVRARAKNPEKKGYSAPKKRKQTSEVDGVNGLEGNNSFGGCYYYYHSNSAEDNSGVDSVMAAASAADLGVGAAVVTSVVKDPVEGAAGVKMLTGMEQLAGMAGYLEPIPMLAHHSLSAPLSSFPIVGSYHSTTNNVSGD